MRLKWVSRILKLYLKERKQQYIEKTDNSMDFVREIEFLLAATNKSTWNCNILNARSVDIQLKRGSIRELREFTFHFLTKVLSCIDIMLIFNL